MEFPEEEDIEGFDVENNFLRRFYRIMIQPTGDLHHSKHPYDTELNRARTQKSKSRKKKTCRKKTDLFIKSVLGN